MLESDLNLIHIGLPKTGSTALQNYWSQAEDIACCWENLSPVISGVRKVVNQYFDFEDLPEFPNLLPDTPRTNAICNVYTSEALSTFSSTARLEADQVSKTRWFFADTLHNKISDAYVLMVIRNPVDWIISVYKQYIQEGGTKSLQRFLNKDRTFLLATLNIRELFNVWSDYYSASNIIMLPYELLRSDRSMFNQLLVQRMGLDNHVRLVGELSGANQSISDREIQFMRTSSRWLKKIEKNSERAAVTMKLLRKDFSLAMRSELQMSGKLSRFVNRAVVPTCLKMTFDEAMSGFLEENFFGFLADNDKVFQPYLPEYRQRLAEVQPIA